MDEKSTSHAPDLVCFTGGEDIGPQHYGEKRLPRTYINSARDAREILMFERYLGIPKIGICRGGQLLNVLSGGAMWQDVNNHTADHKMIDLISRKPLLVTSTHHQMMIPGEQGHIIGIAEKLATKFISQKQRTEPKYDTEVVWYPKTFSMCFQPHPEYTIKTHGDECQDYFFNLIEWAFDL